MSDENKVDPENPAETKEDQNQQEVKKPTMAGIQKDLESFKDETRGMFNQIIQAVSQQPPIVQGESGKSIQPDDAGPDTESEPVSPKWRKQVETILGPEFGCEINHADDGGVKFTVIVPREKSNATQDHWDMYKADRRTIEVSRTGLEGVKQYCLRIRANLLKSEVQLPKYP